MESSLPQPDRVWRCPARQVGHIVHWHDTLDSTNEQALRLAGRLAEDPSLHGVAVVAGSQSRGRGQHGRVWSVPAGSSVLASVLLQLEPAASTPALLTAWAAVATRDSVARWLGRYPRIKWPNDIYLDGKKMAGILVEKGRGTVVGIGLTVSQGAMAFARAGLNDAGSLAMFAPGQQPSHADALDGLLDALDRWLTALQQGETASLEVAWREGLNLTGRPVRLEALGRVVLGVVERVGLDGVVLAQDDGARRRFTPAEILRIFPLDELLGSSGG